MFEPSPQHCALPVLVPLSQRKGPLLSAFCQPGGSSCCARCPQETRCSWARNPGLPYLGDELEEGVGVEGANRQSYEVEQQPLVKGLLHEGHHAGPHEGAEGDDGHAEETISPHCRWGGASPTHDGGKGECPMAQHPPLRGKEVEGMGRR